MEEDAALCVRARWVHEEELEGGAHHEIVGAAEAAIELARRHAEAEA